MLPGKTHFSGPQAIAIKVSLNFTADFEIRKTLPKCFEVSSPTLLSPKKDFFSR